MKLVLVYRLILNCHKTIRILSNPSTTINYDLPVDGNVSIKLFDVSGKEVATLVNEVRKAGYYSVYFNASNLTSGVYFYSITADNFTATKKMLLVK